MNSDMLIEIFKMQNELDEFIAEKHGLVYPQHIMTDGSPEQEEHKEDEVNNWLVQLVLCIHSETNELQNELQWKHWKVYNQHLDREKILMELVDISFFTMSALLKLEVTPEEFHAAYKAKYDENVARQNNKSKEGKNYGR